MSDDADAIVLIDHRNFSVRTIDASAVVVACVSRLAQAGPRLRTVAVRAYGGWYVDSAASPERFNAAAFYQRSLPSMLSVDDKFFRIEFVFADELAAATKDVSTRLRVTHTVAERKRNERPNLTQVGAACSEPDCALKSVRRWLNKDRGCTATACPLPFESCFRRLEQKQVDTHIISDLIFFAVSRPKAEAIFVISDDIDVIPGIATAQALSAHAAMFVIRFQRSSSYADSYLDRIGASCVTLPP